jgi:hypothetical protein
LLKYFSSDLLIAAIFSMSTPVSMLIESGGYCLPIAAMFLESVRPLGDLNIATILIIEVSDAPTRVTGRKHVFRNIVCDHTAGANHRSRSDMDTRANDRPTAHPNI